MAFGRKGLSADFQPGMGASLAAAAASELFNHILIDRQSIHIKGKKMMPRLVAGLITRDGSEALSKNIFKDFKFPTEAPEPEQTESLEYSSTDESDSDSDDKSEADPEEVSHSDHCNQS